MSHKNYRVLTPNFNHDGESYDVGDVVPLTDGQAAQQIGVSAVEPCDDEPTVKVPVSEEELAAEKAAADAKALAAATKAAAAKKAAAKKK